MSREVVLLARRVDALENVHKTSQTTVHADHGDMLSLKNEVTLLREQLYTLKESFETRFQDLVAKVNQAVTGESIEARFQDLAAQIRDARTASDAAAAQATEGITKANAISVAFVADAEVIDARFQELSAKLLDAVPPQAPEPIVKAAEDAAMTASLHARASPRPVRLPRPGASRLASKTLPLKSAMPERPAMLRLPKRASASLRPPPWPRQKATRLASKTLPLKSAMLARPSMQWSLKHKELTRT